VRRNTGFILILLPGSKKINTVDIGLSLHYILFATAINADLKILTIPAQQAK
jgi:hypothetical protein